jgi:hypothetical protein
MGYCRKVSRVQAIKLCKANACTFEELDVEAQLLNSGAKLIKAVASLFTFEPIRHNYYVCGKTASGLDTFEALHTIAKD